MKLRIKGDSLRLRLTQGELSDFAMHGRVEDRIRFAPGRALTYRLAIDPEATQLAAVLSDQAIEVRVPASAARQWCESDLVTLAGTQADGPVELRIVVEKDFACLQPREEEDESDQFPHPRGSDAPSC